MSGKKMAAWLSLSSTDCRDLSTDFSSTSTCKAEFKFPEMYLNVYEHILSGSY